MNTVAPDFEGSKPDITGRRRLLRPARAAVSIPETVADIDRLTTKRLLYPEIRDKHGRYVIREFEVSDLARLREMNGALFFAPLRHLYGPIGFLNEALKQQKDSRNTRQEFFFAIVDAKTSEAIGSVMLFDYNAAQRSAEIAYFIDPTYQNINVGTDATIDVIWRATQSLGIDYLRATAHPANDFSIALLARLGFKKVGEPFISKYKGDPARKDSYDEKGRPILTPRNLYATTIGNFLDKRRKVKTSEEDLQGFLDARIKRNEIKRDNDLAQRALQKLSPSRMRAAPMPRLARYTAKTEAVPG